MRANVHSIELGGATNLAVLAPIKPGFVDGFETITYLDRLRRLLRAMHAARQNVREAELRKPVFPDSIGRFGIIHSFRYAIVPPFPEAARPAGEPGLSRLSLNVSFDGGWEPYMRVIYRDIGTLLDALFCHCVGYPGSDAPFDTYCRWVRDNEIGDGIFYTDASVSPGDQRYLSEVERLQRETADRDAADAAIARFAVEPERQQVARSFQAVWADPRATLALPLRSLKGLYRLSAYFPPHTGDGAVLIRFAQSALKEFRQIIARPELQASPLWPPIQRALADELAWLAREQPPRQRTDRLTFSVAALQSALLGRADPVSHGCIVMLGVRDPTLAAAHLAGLATRCGEPADAAQVRHHVAFTHAGLVALGIAAEWLDALPQEFAEGMEARCGLLGDVRGNHSDHWARPLRDLAQPLGERIDLTAVHVVVVLRLIDSDPQAPEFHPRLKKAADDLAAGSGLAVLALQPTRTFRNAAGRPTEHFGFADGFSQPQVVAGRAPVPRSDEVRPGELLLGYCNDRGDGPFPAEADEFLDNGSFLVMRKLRQRTDHLDAALGAHPAKQEVLARMMGRRQDGTVLVPLEPSGGPNDFNYDSDRGGAACPFQAHVRRANPRDGREHLPRILRRGMAYGPRPGDAAEPKAERGIVFMAYCASIAEQFETIQRWIAGGNSSGVSSAQADPFLGVPQPGEKRTFRYIDAAGRVARVDLGDKPFVQLDWGLYLFVPSLAALGKLAAFRHPPAVAEEKPVKQDPEPEIEAWRRRLDDPDRSKALWAEVRAEPDGCMKDTPYGTLVGSAKEVFAALRDNEAKHLSVQGYGLRMAESVGLNHLGMDPAGGHSELAPGVNEAIEAIDMRLAFAAAAPLVKEVLGGFMALQQVHPDGRVRAPVDLVSFSERVLARLCTHWIGLPEKGVPPGEEPFMVGGGRVEGASEPPRCPGHLLTASRFIFAPHPRPEVLADGPAQGRAVLTAVEKLLVSGRPLGPLAADIRSRVTPADEKKYPGITARNIAGVLLGFPPTVHGNFVRTMETWIDDKILWACQQALAEVPVAVADPFDRAHQALLAPLFETMRERPVPEMLWRSPVVGGQVNQADRARVVLGIASALTEGKDKAPDKLMFGGSRVTSRDAAEFKTLHACPGYEMGVGVLLALIAGLLDAGTLRPTGSPVLLMLTPAPAPPG